MENRESYLEFIISENYKHQIDVWYKAYNISREKMELFYDFLVSLHSLVENTYLGPDVLYDETDQKGHFTWCWKKIISDFEKEKIFFKETGQHYEYFWNFFLEAYYLTIIENNDNRILDYLDKLFNLKTKKTRSELDIVSELYKLLNQNLKK